ncbi:MAG: hypothetical protein NTW16_16655 [Bacteroidetes bacterium]|nr:hypothetical protein [Bacteroidota bacterium]
MTGENEKPGSTPLTTAKSCDDQTQSDATREETRMTVIKDSVRSAFTAETLSEASLQAFEFAAMNKLSDLGDYQAIVSDTSVALPFREKAREMIRGLFISEEVSFPLTGIETDSIWVQQGLQFAGHSSYCGKLGYSCNPARQIPSNKPDRVTNKGTIDFSVIKHEKVFGTDSLLVWLGKLD